MRMFKNRTVLILIAFAAAVCIIAGAVYFGRWIGNSIYEKLTESPNTALLQGSNDIKSNNHRSDDNDGKDDNNNNSKYGSGVNVNNKEPEITKAKEVENNSSKENNLSKIEKMVSLINNAQRIISKIPGNKQTDKSGDVVPKVTDDIKNAVPEDMLEKVEEKAEEISRTGKMTFNDYMEIFSIISGKLSIDEIKFLFDTAKGDYWEKTPVEDIYKAREILFSKLSDSDIEKLTQIGKKFGRSMDILKKDLDVEEAKKRQMENAGLKQ